MDFMRKVKHSKPFHSAREEVEAVKPKQAEQVYDVAFSDMEFLLREELRPVRLQLELLRPELILNDHNVEETIVFFGSARIPYEAEARDALAAAEAELAKQPDDKAAQLAVTTAKHVLKNSEYLKEATKLSEIITQDKASDRVVVTGGGPSFMEAANKGAQNVNGRSVSLNVILPHEQCPNPFVTPELTFHFHYFAIRKMHFLMRAQALVAFPGGFGTLDELFEALTLIQTQKIDRLPMLLFNEAFWRDIIDFDALVRQGTISPEDLDLFCYVETAEEAWEKICEFDAS